MQCKRFGAKSSWQTLILLEKITYYIFLANYFNLNSWFNKIMAQMERNLALGLHIFLNSSTSENYFFDRVKRRKVHEQPRDLRFHTLRQKNCLTMCCEI